MSEESTITRIKSQILNEKKESIRYSPITPLDFRTPMEALWEKKQKVDLGRVGNISSGLHPPIVTTTQQLIDLGAVMSAFQTASDLLDGLSERPKEKLYIRIFDVLGGFDIYEYYRNKQVFLRIKYHKTIRFLKDIKNYRLVLRRIDDDYEDL